MKTVTTLVALATLTACSTTAPVDLRTVLGAGYSTISVDPSGASNTDHQGQTTTARIEVSQELDYLDNVEVGLRAIGGLGTVDDADGDVLIDADNMDLGGALVVRTFYDVSDSARLYAEMFGGYRHFWVEQKGFRDEDDGGLLFGLGVGTEFQLSSSTSLILGAEWARTMTKKRHTRNRLDDLSALIGLSVSF
jgi:hypothetical protein